MDYTSHASRSFLPLAYTQMECFVALQKQWMTLLATHRPIFQAMSGPQIRYFTGFLVTMSDGYGLVVYHTRGTWMLQTPCHVVTGIQIMF